MTSFYNLPNGEQTDDREEMEKAWEAEYKPLEEAFGMICVSSRYLDVFTFEDSRERHGVVRIPLWLARRIRVELEDEVCSVCGGEPLSISENFTCICGGKGTAYAEMQGLRKRVAQLERVIHDGSHNIAE